MAGPDPLLGAATSALAGVVDHRGALSAVARALVPELARWCVLYLRDGAGAVRQVASAHVDLDLARRLRHLGRRVPISLGDGRGSPAIGAGSTPLLVPQLSRQDAIALLGMQAGAGDAIADELEGLGTGSLLVTTIPLIGADVVVTVACVRAPDVQPFDEADRDRLATLAAHVAPVLAFALRASQEAQARAEAEAARMHVTQALDELPDGFVALDRDWRVTYLNVAAATLWHLSRASALGRTFWELVRVPADAPLRTGSARAMLEGVAYEGELHMGDAWLGVRAVPSRMGVSLYIRDVTGRRTADAERERLLGEADRARAAAEQANQAKTDFLATMSHELRTPLNAILGYVALIADGISGPVTDGQMKHLGRVRASASHLLALIEEVLSFARLEAGSESARSEPADVVALGREAAQLVEPVIEAHGLRFAVEAPEGALSIRTDARKVRQILLNLLANAARFTPAGGEVVLSISVGPAGARLTVRDSGIGIEPEHQQQIFQPFWQVEQKLTRRAGGTGLGLSVSRRLARLLGGDVTVESAPGRGSAFTLTLPLEPWSPGAAGAGADG